MKHPEWAFDENGELWWKAGLSATSKKKKPLGSERRICVYLAATKEVGDTFTTSELRVALETDHEHFQRRLRALRSAVYGWALVSYQDDSSLPPESYRIDRVGWHPSLGPKPKDLQVVSQKSRRLVIERDRSRCVICGVGANEMYPGEPDSAATMTVGHILPQERGGTNDLDNLRTECSRCNETARSDTRSAETADELWASSRNLKLEEKRSLAAWINSGRRARTKLDDVYDRYRMLPPNEKRTFIDFVAQSTRIVIEYPD